jgi:hypothetical protein
MKNGQKLKLGDAHATPRNTQEVQASKLGDAPEAPLSSSAKIRSPFKTVYFYCFMHYAFFLERQLFLLSVFFCFSCCNTRFDHIMLFLERDLFHFSFAKNTLFFTLSFNECSLFLLLLLRLAFDFCLDLCSDLVISLHQGVF